MSRYVELTMYDTPTGTLSIPVRDVEEAEKIVAVVHEIMLGDKDTPSRYQILQQWGISKETSPFRLIPGAKIDGIEPTKAPYE